MVLNLLTTHLFQVEFVLEHSRKGEYEASGDDIFSEMNWGEHTGAYMVSIETLSENSWRQIIDGALGYARLFSTDPSKSSNLRAKNKRSMFIDLSEEKE